MGSLVTSTPAKIAAVSEMPFYCKKSERVRGIYLAVFHEAIRAEGDPNADKCGPK